MNLLDLLALVGFGMVLYGVKLQLESIIDAFGLPEKVRLQGYKDTRPYSGFALTFLGWLLTVFVLGGAVKGATNDYIFVVTALTKLTGTLLFVSGVLLILAMIVLGARFLTPK